jgi:hypothetical protein
LPLDRPEEVRGLIVRFATPGQIPRGVHSAVTRE